MTVSPSLAWLARSRAICSKYSGSIIQMKRSRASSSSSWALLRRWITDSRCCCRLCNSSEAGSTNVNPKKAAKAKNINPQMLSMRQTARSRSSRRRSCSARLRILVNRIDIFLPSPLSKGYKTSASRQQQRVHARLLSSVIHRQGRYGYLESGAFECAA